MSGTVCEKSSDAIGTLGQPQIGFGLPFQLAAKVTASLAGFRAGIFMQHTHNRAVVSDGLAVQFFDQTERLGRGVGVNAQVGNAINEDGAKFPVNGGALHFMRHGLAPVIGRDIGQANSS